MAAHILALLVSMVSEPGKFVFKREPYSYREMAVVSLCLLLLSVLLVLATVDSKLIEGVIQTQKNWAFLSRFCFVRKGGRYEYVFEYASEYEVLNLLGYHDANGKWLAAYKGNLSCFDKEDALHPSQIIKLKPNTNGCRRVNTFGINGTIINYSIECTASFRLTGIRNRWWYMAISNCQSKKGLNLKYKISMRNGEVGTGNDWFAHFSADEFYIIHNLLIFFILYVCLLALSLYVCQGLLERDLLHTTFKLYLASMTSQTIGLMFQFIAFDQYAKDGQGIPSLKAIGQIFLFINSLLFTYLVLLLGKGYTVTRVRLSRRSKYGLALFMSVYSICYVILIIFEMEILDPAEVLYLYESPAGYSVLVLRMIGWIVLMYAVCFTVKHHPIKIPFYVPFLLFYSFWFISMPTLIMIITYFVGNWVRATILVGLDLLISFLGYLFFLILTWPNCVNKTFPFHIKTTRVIICRIFLKIGFKRRIFNDNDLMVLKSDK